VDCLEAGRLTSTAREGSCLLLEQGASTTKNRRGDGWRPLGKVRRPRLLAAGVWRRGRGSEQRWHGEGAGPVVVLGLRRERRGAVTDLLCIVANTTVEEVTGKKIKMAGGLHGAALAQAWAHGHMVGHAGC
jgi:hypothetical protein